MENMIHTLVGYVRKTKEGKDLQVTISVKAFDEAQRYAAQDGAEYVNLVVKLDKVNQIIDGSRDVTSVCQIEEVA